MALREGKIRICRCCADAVREFGLYRWDEGRADDAPVKENDHAMDDIRYFVTTVLRPCGRIFRGGGAAGKGGDFLSDFRKKRIPREKQAACR